MKALETRRLQIEVFLILNGNEHIVRYMLFTFKEGSRTRGHKPILVKKQSRLDTRNDSFSLRMIDEWNKLSNDCDGYT